MSESIKMTVMISEDSEKSLKKIAAITKISETEVIAQVMSLADYVVSAVARGDKVVFVHPNKSMSELFHSIFELTK